MQFIKCVVAISDVYVPIDNLLILQSWLNRLGHPCVKTSVTYLHAILLAQLDAHTFREQNGEDPR